MRSTIWYAPEKVRRYFAFELTRKPPPSSGQAATSERQELIAYKQT